MRKKMFLPALFLLTLLRIWLAVKTPLFLQGDAGCDDYLLVRYAANLLTGNWLGAFDQMTLAKSISFPVILALDYLLGIPYSLGLILSYVSAAALVCFALSRLIPGRAFAGFTYVFLLYSPVMFHEENVQKVYRGGYIVVFSLMVFAAVIGMYASASREKAVLWKWSLVCAGVLPAFWFLKEDSVWIMPFVLGGLACAGVRVFLSRKTAGHIALRFLFLLLPLIVLGATTSLYKFTNYVHYGEYAVTDRQDTYFGKMLGALMQIRDENLGQVWVTRDMLDKAFEVSPALRSVQDCIEDGYEKGYWVNGNGEVDGDLIIWALRQDFSDAGIYEKGGRYADEFYKDIYEELEEAFDTGKLERSEGKWYLSPIAIGFTPGEFMAYYGARTPEVLQMLITYSENVSSSQPATGPYDNIAVMAELTNSKFTRADTVNPLQPYDDLVLRMDGRIVWLYQKLGVCLAVLGGLGGILLLLQVVRELFSKRAGRDGAVLLVLLGLLGTCIADVFGVMWFCSFLPARKVYDYVCGVIPAMEIIQAIGITYAGRWVLAVIRRIRPKSTS